MPVLVSPHFTPCPSAWMLLAAAFVLTGCDTGEGPPSPTVPRPVLVAPVLSAPLGGLAFAGELRARDRAELSFAVAGVVREVVTEVGASVRRGQVLARLDAVPSQAQLAATDAEGRRLQALLSDAQRREQRLQAARDINAASDAEWTAVQAEVQAARAAWAAAQAQRASAVWNREQTELRAPFDGRVSMRQLEVGQAVSAGAAVISIEGRGRELWLAIPATVTLDLGETVTMTRAGSTADGRVLQLSARLEAGGARRVLLSAPDSWPTGEAVSVKLWRKDREATALQVPLRAVQLDPARTGYGHVLRLSPGAQVPERVAVALGAVQGEQVEVRNGLAAGQQVVVAGGQSLTPGLAVTPVSRLR